MFSLVVPTHSKPTTLLPLLESIEQQNFPFSEIEVIIVLNGRNYGEINREWPFKVKWLLSPNAGVNNARNQGLQASKYPYVYFFDDDCKLASKNHLALLKTKIANDPTIPAFGGPYLKPKNWRVGSKLYHRTMSDWWTEQKISSQWTRNLLGGNVCYQKSFLFESRICFPPEIKYGSSETYLHNFLFNKFGSLFYSDQFAVEHNHSTSLIKYFSKAYAQGLGTSFSEHNYPEYKTLQTTVKENKSFNQSLYSLFFMYGYRVQLEKSKSKCRIFIEECINLLRQR